MTGQIRLVDISMDSIGRLHGHVTCPRTDADIFGICTPCSSNIELQLTYCSSMTTHIFNVHTHACFLDWLLSWTLSTMLYSRRVDIELGSRVSDS